jgi:hypothetical protein
MDMNDRTLVIVITQGIGANLTNDEKRPHLVDLKREHLIDQYALRKSCHPNRDFAISGLTVMRRFEARGRIKFSTCYRFTTCHQSNAGLNERLVRNGFTVPLFRRQRLRGITFYRYNF